MYFEIDNDQIHLYLLFLTTFKDSYHSPLTSKFTMPICQPKLIKRYRTDKQRLYIYIYITGYHDIDRDSHI